MTDFAEQCKYQIAKAKWTNNTICNWFEVHEARLKLYTAYVLLTSEYCSFVYTSMRQCNERTLERALQEALNRVLHHYNLPREMSKTWFSTLMFREADKQLPLSMSSHRSRCRSKYVDVNSVNIDIEIVALAVHTLKLQRYRKNRLIIGRTKLW